VFPALHIKNRVALLVLDRAVQEYINLAEPFLTGNAKTSAANFANSHEFIGQFAQIRVIRGKESFLYGLIPPNTGEPQIFNH
jgi:hypothetical protein